MRWSRIIFGLLLLALGTVVYVNRALLWQSLNGQACVAGRAIVHTVQPDETMWAIANRYAISLECLSAFNGLVPEPLHLGQILTIPLASSGPSLTPLLTSFVLGWGVGWAVFEITEWRRATARRRALRVAVLEELKRVEMVLSQKVCEFAFGADDPTNGMKELRWLIDHSRGKSLYAEILPREIVDSVARSDEELANEFRAIKRRAPTSSLPVPVIGAVLGDLNSALTRKQWEWLGGVKWEADMLEMAAMEVQTWLRFTFTVLDPEKYQTVEKNYEGYRTEYAMRANHMLGAVRNALKTFDGEEDLVA